ncbi:MAG: FHA domain-containing protein [Planctomycetota bacterium]
MATIEIFEKESERKISLRDDLTAFGRESTCQIQLDDEKLSRKHCRIERKKGGYVLVDLSSKNGTYVNDIAVFPSKVLRDGDVIKLGDVRMVFHHRTLSDRLLYFLHIGWVWRVFWSVVILGALFGVYWTVNYFFTTMLK